MILLIVAGVLAAAVLIAALVVLMLFVVQKLGGTAGGLRRLAATYPADGPAPPRLLAGETIKVGAVVYKRCARLAVTDRGLYVAVWGRAALIPWSEFRAVASATLYWQTLPLLTVGDPPVATLVIPAAIFDRLRSRLPEELQDWPPRAAR